MFFIIFVFHNILETTENDIFTICNVFNKAEERGELQLPMANRSAYSHILFQDYDPMEALQRLDIIFFHQILLKYY